jgi:NAD(P)-dependent dehydrogenase (short-subunit alcohol dehydrogenase family)
MGWAGATTRESEMRARFGDKVALVTGAGSGIGRETVRLLGSEGARVVCLDVDPQRVEDIAAELAAGGCEAHGHCCDVSDPSACNGAVDATLERFGRLDLLCNVAGISMMRTIDQVDDALWNRMIGVNLGGPFYLCRAAVPALVESRGNIVNVASQAGLRGYSHLSAYSAAKGGLVMLTRALAVELAPQCVRVNCVCPGAVLTNIADSMAVGGAFDQQVAEAMLQRNPRISPPEDVARAIVFLASDDASSATGAVLAVDGGSTA